MTHFFKKYIYQKNVEKDKKHVHFSYNTIRV